MCELVALTRCCKLVSFLHLIIGSNEQVVTESRQKADVFNAYFASVGVLDDGRVPVCDDDVALSSVLDNIVIRSVDVCRLPFC